MKCAPFPLRCQTFTRRSVSSTHTHTQREKKSFVAYDRWSNQKHPHKSCHPVVWLTLFLCTGSTSCPFLKEIRFEIKIKFRLKMTKNTDAWEHVIQDLGTKMQVWKWIQNINCEYSSVIFAFICIQRMYVDDRTQLACCHDSELRM